MAILVEALYHCTAHEPYPRTLNVAEVSLSLCLSRVSTFSRHKNNNSDNKTRVPTNQPTGFEVLARVVT